MFCFLFLKLHYARGNYIRQRLSPQFVTAFIYSVCHLKTVVLFSLSLIKREIVSRGRPTMHHSFVRMCLKLYISLHYFFLWIKRWFLNVFDIKKEKSGNHSSLTKTIFVSRYRLKSTKQNNKSVSNILIDFCTFIKMYSDITLWLWPAY